MPSDGPIDAFAVANLVTPCQRTADCGEPLDIPDLFSLGEDSGVIEQELIDAGYENITLEKGRPLPAIARHIGSELGLDVIYAKGGFGSFWCSPTVVVGLKFDSNKALKLAKMWRQQLCL